MSPPLSLGLTALDLGRAIVSGAMTEPLEIARALADLAVQVLPVDELKKHLDEAAVRRAEVAADLAEDVKFPR